MLEDDFYESVEERFAKEIDIWESNKDVHLITIATFGTSASGIAKLEEIALMTVSDNWIPFDGQDELTLVNELVKMKRHFIKSLRYNLPSAEPVASALLTHYGNEVLALYVCPSSASDTYLDGIKALIDQSEIKSWLWNAKETAMPALPDVRNELGKTG